MSNPTNLLYAKSHEWVQDMGDGSYRIGLTDYAQDQLGDLVFVNLPQEGDEVEVGAAFGDVESVKAVSDVYSPVSGVVCAINEELLDHPELINQDAYGAWMIQVNEVSDKEELLSSTDYEALLSQEAYHHGILRSFYLAGTAGDAGIHRAVQHRPAVLPYSR